MKEEIVLTFIVVKVKQVWLRKIMFKVSCDIKSKLQNDEYF